MNYKKYEVRKCRICKNEELFTFLDLGMMPIPNGFIQKKDLKKAEQYYPLQAAVCTSCWLTQLKYVIPSDLMFKNYLYIPSTSKTMRNHFKSLAEDIIAKNELSGRSLVVDIGSNDGTLLSFFKENGTMIQGVDPAANLATIAKLKGIETIPDFFNEKVAKKIVKQKGRADIVTATNVVAHINDLDCFFTSIQILLKPRGKIIMEFPYLVDLLENNEYDAIYHEHLSYFAIGPLIKILNKHLLRITNITSIAVHGGSLRVEVQKMKNRTYRQTSIAERFLRYEFNHAIGEQKTYIEFSKRVGKRRNELISLLHQLHTNGKKIVGYGASAKGNVLLNYCGLDSRLISYIVDSIPYKQGLYTPGTHIPIFSEKWIQKQPPDYILILAWNFYDEIVKKQSSYQKSGGKFIQTIPNLTIN